MLPQSFFVYASEVVALDPLCAAIHTLLPPAPYLGPQLHHALQAVAILTSHTACLYRPCGGVSSRAWPHHEIRLVTSAAKTQVLPMILCLEHAPLCCVVPWIGAVAVQCVAANMKDGALLGLRLARHTQ